MPAEVGTKPHGAMLKQLGVQRMLEARDAARYGCVIDAQLLAGGRNGLVAANAQEEEQIIPFKATIAVSHSSLRPLLNLHLC